MGTDMDRENNGRSVVVVGVDSSTASHQAVVVSLNFARITRGPDVHFVHVIKPATGLAVLHEWSGLVSEYERSMVAARVELAELCASAAARLPLRAFAHVRTGEPHQEIIQLASDVEADLIVIGTHSRGGLARLLGSVAARVQRAAPRPVRTGKAKRLPAWG